MKPLHVGVLLVAGAFGGAMIMKVAFQPQTVAPAPGAAAAPRGAGEGASHGRAGQTISGGAGESGTRGAEAGTYAPRGRDPASGRGRAAEPGGCAGGAHAGCSHIPCRAGACACRTGAASSSTRAR